MSLRIVAEETPRSWDWAMALEPTGHVLRDDGAQHVEAPVVR